MNSDSILRSMRRIVSLRCWIDRPEADDAMGAVVWGVEEDEDVWASCWRRRLLDMSKMLAGGVERGRMGNQQYTYDREVSSDWRAKLGVDFFYVS